MPEQCAICQQRLQGRVCVDTWDNHFCARHLEEYLPCTCCQRLVCPALTGGLGMRYADGRLVCSACRDTAVDTSTQAKTSVELVAQRLARLGVRFRGLRLNVKLGEHNEFQQVNFGDTSSVTGVGSGLIMGYIEREREINAGVTEKRLVNGIWILRGLPRSLFEGVAAHEMAHAWLFLAGVDNLPAWAEEGFCHMMSYVLYRNYPIENADYWVRLIERDPSPIYGGGFRKVQAFFKKRGFTEALSYIYQKKQFPEGIS